MDNLKSVLISLVGVWKVVLQPHCELDGFVALLSAFCWLFFFPCHTSAAILLYPYWI